MLARVTCLLLFIDLMRKHNFVLSLCYCPDGPGLDINRVELDDIFSGRVSKLKGLPLGVEVLTDTYHNLQDQAFMLMRKNKFSECFMDSIMR